MSNIHKVNPENNPHEGFHPSAHRSKPTMSGGHQPGRRVAPADFVPQSHVEKYPPGTAPASNSFAPNPYNESGSQANNPNVERGHGKESTKTSAADTLTGATSKDVHTGLGHPGSGQTSTELRHDGQHGRKNPGVGLEGVGASKENKFERHIPEQRGIERDQAQGGQRGNKGALAAQEREPEIA
ncbi:hypothetical protein FE257_010228 [Aspergillus nanangensis]|uniref:Uncharacterized protein n=1 Tax=Aspergillus nanangensis TaxID=2582783 RepID=A0AAD4CKE1_ASPNN|nr:hypothetical protein FE257_010228 [Aspergillus nanangensis]